VGRRVRRHIHGADAEFDAAELQTAIDAALAELPNRCREAFVLSQQHDLSHAEVSGIMGTTVKTVENHVNKARGYLRRRLAAWLED